MSHHHRRISLTDLELTPSHHSQQRNADAAQHLPPRYLDYKPGGREEFFRDLEAYQAAAQINAQHRQISSPTRANNDEEHEAPSYDSIGEALPTIHETKVFRRRLLETLRAIRDFTEKRRHARKWSNFFGVSQSFRLALASVLIVAMIGGIVVMSITFRQVAGLLALCVFLVVFTGFSFFMVRKYIYQQRLVEALLIALGKVERFDKIDDKTLGRVKKGIDATLSPLFWIESERRMEEAIPEELRVHQYPGELLPPPAAHLPPPPTPSPPPVDTTAITPEVRDGERRDDLDDKDEIANTR